MLNQRIALTAFMILVLGSASSVAISGPAGDVASLQQLRELAVVRHVSSDISYRFPEKITHSEVERFIVANCSNLRINEDVQFRIDRMESAPGGRHIRVKQIYANLPVFRGEMMISLDESNSVTIVSDALKKNISLASTAP